MSTQFLFSEQRAILEKLATLRQEARQLYKADLKGVFGSVARGEATNESDLDVLVDFLAEADLFDFVGLGQFLEEQLNCRVDVVPQADIRTELRQRILQETIYL